MRANPERFASPGGLTELPGHFAAMTLQGDRISVQTAFGRSSRSFQLRKLSELVAKTPAAGSPLLYFGAGRENPGLRLVSWLTAKIVQEAFHRSLGYLNSIGMGKSRDANPEATNEKRRLLVVFGYGKFAAFHEQASANSP